MTAGFVERFVARAEERPDSAAIVMAPEGRTISYRELREKMESIAGALAALGVEPESHVLVMLPSGPELVATLYALASLRAVAVPLGEGTTAYELVPMLAIAKPRGAVVATDRVLGVLGRNAELSFVLWLGDRAPGPSPLAVHVASAVDAAPRALEAPPADTIVTCHFTYKGIGRVLGARHRYASFSRVVDGIVSAHAGAAEGDHLVALPMFPVYGLVLTVMVPLSLGVGLVVLRLAAGAQLLDALERYRIRAACLVPPLLATLAKAARKDPASVAKLRPELELACGGSVLSDDVAAAVRETLGRDVLQGYGATETLPVTACRGEPDERGTLGAIIVDAARIVVCDAEGRAVPLGTTGAIAIGGPTLAAHYLGDEEATGRFFAGGLFHTGDIGHLDASGRLHFEGRSLAFAKSISQMVDLRELEDVARMHPAVLDARAVSAMDARLGECVDLGVRVRPGASLAAKELTSHVRTYLAPHKVPRQVRIVPSDGEAP